MNARPVIWIGRIGGAWCLRIKLGADCIATLPGGATIEDTITLAEAIRSAPLCVEPKGKP